MALEIQTKVIVRPDYESVLIISPDLSEQAYRELVGKFLDLIKNAGGEIVNVEYWGSKKLAYPIKRKSSGYYSYFEFKCDPGLIAKLEQEYIYEENVIRYITVKLDKHSVAYNNKRRAMKANPKEVKN